ncbi:DPEP2 neighbor protein-like [Delphinus delphis]|uniref:DPEP2 neighbor protein-like n=1 Tax=Delphinus delphis TaxID=9728 RepID=UPI0028C4082D|nr:DPEP2 neighbor protein-like [Delphinus delphis]
MGRDALTGLLTVSVAGSPPDINLFGCLRKSDRIVYMYSNRCSDPWVGSAAAAVAPISPPTPGHYHVLYRGCGEMQLGRHGETYFLVGGYRVYGDVALATPAKVEAEKPVPRRAPKRNHAPERSDKDLGFPRPKIRRLKHSSSSGIQGALILKQGGPTSGHIPSATAPVNECPIFAFSRSATGSPLLKKVLSHCHTIKDCPKCDSFLGPDQAKGRVVSFLL